MKLAVYGAGGTIGRRITQEALRRGHQITAVVRNPARFEAGSPAVEVVQGDVPDRASVMA